MNVKQLAEEERVQWDNGNDRTECKEQNGGGKNRVGQRNRTEKQLKKEPNRKHKME